MTVVLTPTESTPATPQQTLSPPPSASPAAAVGPRELERMAQLRSSGVMVTRPQPALDALARTAAALCGVELGLVNFLDETTQTTAASVGWLEAGFATQMPRSDSVCQYTITSTEDVTEIGDLSVDPRTKRLPLNSDGLRFYAGASVLSESKAALGAVCVLDRTSHVLTAAQRRGLQDLAAVAATLIEQHALAQRLVGVTDRLGQEAGTDTLTGLYNRRALEPVLANLPPRTAVAMIDLDHFKALNDRAGHHAGDQALRGFAELFHSSLRAGDVAARWGGEEFLLVLDDVDQPRRVLDRILAGARATQPVTFSAGLTVAGVGEDPVELLQRADRLLYLAKAAGRNRIVDDLSTAAPSLR